LLDFDLSEASSLPPITIVLGMQNKNNK